MEASLVVVRPKVSVQRSLLPKSIKIFFMIAHILLSEDYGFLDCKIFRTRLFFKTFYFLQSLFVCTSCLVLMVIGPLKKIFIVWYAFSIFEYFSFVLLLMFHSDEHSFAKLQEKLCTVDMKLSIDSRSHHLAFKIMLYYFLVVIIRVCLVYCYCYLYPLACITPLAAQVFYMVPVFGLDLPMVISFFVFYSTYCRLKILTTAIQKGESNVVSYQYIYKSIALALEMAMKTTERKIAVSFLFNIPIMMVSLYYCLANMSRGEEMANIALQYIPIVMAPLLLCAPAVAASWLSSQAEALKVILHDRLLEERDTAHACDIKRFIDYIDARPFKYCFYKVIDFDAMFPVHLLNVCVTYMIVVVQFTHLY